MRSSACARRSARPERTWIYRASPLRDLRDVSGVLPQPRGSHRRRSPQVCCAFARRVSRPSSRVALNAAIIADQRALHQRKLPSPGARTDGVRGNASSIKRRTAVNASPRTGVLAFQGHTRRARPDRASGRKQRASRPSCKPARAPGGRAQGVARLPERRRASSRRVSKRRSPALRHSCRRRVWRAHVERGRHEPERARWRLSRARCGACCSRRTPTNSRWPRSKSPASNPTRKLKSLALVESPVAAGIGRYPRRVYTLFALLVGLAIVLRHRAPVVATIEDHQE